jgi:hypothetical protein
MPLSDASPWQALEENRRLVALLLQTLGRHRDTLATMTTEAARFVAMTNSLLGRLAESSAIEPDMITDPVDAGLSPYCPRWQRLARDFEPGGGPEDD